MSQCASEPLVGLGPGHGPGRAGLGPLPLSRGLASGLASGRAAGNASAIDVSPPAAPAAWRVNDEVRAGALGGAALAGPRAASEDGAKMTATSATPSAPGTPGPDSLSAECSLVDDLDLDLWEGQFEFVGPGFGAREEDDGDVITPAMVRCARAECVDLADAGMQEAQQWCDHLSDQVQMLQQQVGVLADNQTNTDERYTRAKQDNAALQARVLMLEEQVRETELRAEERLQDEQKRHRELMVRVEREKQLELENCAIRLQTMELEANTLKDEVNRLRLQSDQLRAEKLQVQEALVDSEAALAALRDEVDQQREGLRQREAEHQQREQLVDELGLEIDRLRESARRQSPRDRDSDQAGQVVALSAQLERVREEARSLREANEELQALVLTRGVEEGRSLLTGGLGSSSLAAELEAMSQDEIRQALKEQQEMNSQLRQYIDGILINIIENYPELLEVRKS